MWTGALPTPTCAPTPLHPALQIISHVQSQSSGSGIAPLPQEELPAGTFLSYQPYVDLMAACWTRDPEQRPKFGDIVQQLRWLLKLVVFCSCAASAVALAALPTSLGLAPYPGCMHGSDAACCCPCCQHCLPCRAMLATELKQRLPQSQQPPLSPKPQREASSLDATAVAPEQAPMERLGSTPGLATI